MKRPPLSLILWLIVSAIIFAGEPLRSQEIVSDNPGWRLAHRNSTEPITLDPSDEMPVAAPLPVPRPLDDDSTPAPDDDAAAPLAQIVMGNDADTITQEITDLAIGLNKDPVRMFLWVRNNIEYSHYYGCKKGAALTLWERSGNDADQSALLVALARAAGYSAKYLYCMFVIPTAGDTKGNDLIHWLGVDATSSGVLNRIMNASGIASGQWGIYDSTTRKYFIYRFSPHFSHPIR